MESPALAFLISRKALRQRWMIDEKFGDIVDLVIDGGIGGTEGSTVVDCTNGEPEIIRQGLGWLDEG